MIVKYLLSVKKWILIILINIKITNIIMICDILNYK